MASGTYNLSLEHPSSSVSFQGKLEWTSTSNGSSANSSNVVVKLYARKQGSSTATSGTFKGSITIDGTKTTFSQSKSVLNSWVLISTSSKTVSHNADGTKSITIAGEVGKVSGTTLANINSTGSTSITLDTIPRYATIQSVSITTDEEPINITINAPAYGNYTNLEVCVSRDNYTPIDSWHNIISMSSTPLININYNLNNTELTSIYMNNTTTSEATIYILLRSTLNGVSSTNKITKTLPIKVDKPTWTPNYSLLDTNSSVVAITQDNTLLVQNLSNISMTFSSASPKKYATITNYDFIVGYLTAHTSTAGTINLGTYNQYGTHQIQGTATDSRGLSTSNEGTTFRVVEYYTPHVFMDLNRLNNYEDTTYLTGYASYPSVEGKNSITMQYRYKEVGGSFGAWQNMTPNVQITLSLDKEKEYEFEVKATDVFGGSTTATGKLNKGIFPLFIDTTLNSVGVNKFPEYNNSLEVGGVAVFDKSISAGGDISLRTTPSGTKDKKIDLSFTNTDGTKGSLNIQTVSGSSLLNSYIGMYGDRKDSNNDEIDSFALAEGELGLKKTGYSDIKVSPISSVLNDLKVNGCDIAKNKILWSGGTTGSLMKASQTATLSENVSSQANGIVLVWSAYASGSAQNYNWHCDFIPKEFVNFSGRGYLCIMASSKFTNIATKYVYINDNSITGNDDNSTTGTGSGITYTNNSYVLRYVIGV